MYLVKVYVNFRLQLYILYIAIILEWASVHVQRISISMNIIIDCV
jgi:hypothetical protein